MIQKKYMELKISHVEELVTGNFQYPKYQRINKSFLSNEKEGTAMELSILTKDHDHK